MVGLSTRPKRGRMTLTVISTTSTTGLILSTQNPLTTITTGAIKVTNQWVIFGPGDLRRCLPPVSPMRGGAAGDG